MSNKLVSLPLICYKLLKILCQTIACDCKVIELKITKQQDFKLQIENGTVLVFVTTIFIFQSSNTKINLQIKCNKRHPYSIK